MKRNYLLHILILLLIPLQGLRCGERKERPFFFIQVTDPQFGFIEDNKSFEKETQLYERAVAEINRLNPDFVVITGDLVNNSGDKNQVQEFKRITGMIKPSIPVYYTPGNHDIGQAPQQKDIDEFIMNYGHDRFSFIHKKSLFIGLNSCLIKSETLLLEESQFRWLSGELAKNKGAKHKIIFCHYPFFISQPDEPDQYFNIPSGIRKKYLTLFSENNVDAIFAGHLHNNAYGKAGKMEMITTSAVGKPLAKAPSGLRIIKVYPDRIENQYYSLEEISKLVAVF
jgi:3',5'-cyclic AMP phosphodiesterase CpdA